MLLSWNTWIGQQGKLHGVSIDDPKEDSMCCKVEVDVRLNKSGGKTWTIRHTADCGRPNEIVNGG
jgi:hypothetical protein